jgi:Bacterial PH domain
VSDVEKSAGPTYVWRADGRYRVAGAAAMALLLLLSLRVLMVYGLGAIIGVVLVLVLIAWTWWVLLRPRLTASPDGVEVVRGRAPVRVSWPEIRRCEPTPDGLKITVKDGREVVARYPQQRVAATAEPTEADAAATYLAQRAAWARRPTGPMPVYVPPPRPAKPVRA